MIAYEKHNTYGAHVWSLDLPATSPRPNPANAST